jgi:hypothetical protein
MAKLSLPAIDKSAATLSPKSDFQELGRLAIVARDLGRDVGSTADAWKLSRRTAYNFISAYNARDWGLSATEVQQIGSAKLAALAGNLKVLPGTRKLREMSGKSVREFHAAINGYEADDHITLTVEAGVKKAFMAYLKSLGYSGRNVRSNTKAVRRLMRSSRRGAAIS